MGDQSLNIICKGELEIVKITEDMHDQAIKFFTDNFIPRENISIAINLSNSPQAVKEIQHLCRDLLKENISFAMRNISTGELSAIIINHLMSAQRGNDTLSNVMKGLKTPEMLCVYDLTRRLETEADIYKALQIDCAMEVAFLATSTEYTRCGVGAILTEYSINYARRLKEGRLSEKEQPAKHLRLLKPGAVCSIVSSLFTQRIGGKLGTKVLAKLPYTEISFDGKAFAERMDPVHECVTLEALLL